MERTIVARTGSGTAPLRHSSERVWDFRANEEDGNFILDIAGDAKGWLISFISQHTTINRVDQRSQLISQELNLRSKSSETLGKLGNYFLLAHMFIESLAAHAKQRCHTNNPPSRYNLEHVAGWPTSINKTMLV